MVTRAQWVRGSMVSTDADVALVISSIDAIDRQFSAWCMGYAGDHDTALASIARHSAAMLAAVHRLRASGDGVEKADAAVAAIMSPCAGPLDRTPGYAGMPSDKSFCVGIPPTAAPLDRTPSDGSTAADMPLCIGMPPPVEPADPNLQPAEDRAAAADQCRRVLDVLLRAGSAGVLGCDLADISARYGARIHDLRTAGYGINSRRVGRSLWRYTLISTERRI